MELACRMCAPGSSSSCTERSAARSSTPMRPIIVMRTVTIISNYRPLMIALVLAVMSLVFVRTVGDGSILETALRSIKLIHAAETNYYSQYGCFAHSMEELRPRILDDDLATGVKDGYRFH